MRGGTAQANGDQHQGALRWWHFPPVRTSRKAPTPRIEVPVLGGQDARCSRYTQWIPRWGRRNARMNSRVALLAGIALAVLLTGCGDKKDKPATQTAAMQISIL